MQFCDCRFKALRGTGGAGQRFGNQSAQSQYLRNNRTPVPDPDRFERLSVQSRASWPTNAGAYALEATTNLFATNSRAPATNIPAIVDFQKTITNAISRPGQYYRVRKQ